ARRRRGDQTDRDEQSFHVGPAPDCIPRLGVLRGYDRWMPPPAAVIFDFDGIVLDSETPEYESHRRIYERCGVTLTIDEWCGVIGTWSEGHDEQWFVRLCERSAQAPPRDEYFAERRRIFDEI